MMRATKEELLDSQADEISTRFVKLFVSIDQRGRRVFPELEKLVIDENYSLSIRYAAVFGVIMALSAIVVLLFFFGVLIGHFLSIISVAQLLVVILFLVCAGVVFRTISPDRYDVLLLAIRKMFDRTWFSTTYNALAHPDILPPPAFGRDIACAYCGEDNIETNTRCWKCERELIVIHDDFS